MEDFRGLHPVEEAIRLHQEGKFKVGGRPPKLSQVGNGIEPDGSGRTVTIGVRENGKRLTVYEKGMQLGCPGHPWMRWEVSLGKKNRIIPWEVLLEPGRYFVGAYPKALNWVQDEMSRIRTLQKQTQISYEVAVAQAKRQFGPTLKEAEGRASLKEYKRQVKFWTEHFRELPLDAITRHAVADLVEAKAKTPATRNRYIACLRAILMKAAGAWEWLDRAPKLKTYSEPKQRIRWIGREEAEKLLAALPDWVQAMARFAFATGLRQSNVLKLEWTQVDLKRRVAWIHPDQAKARRAIGVPLNEDALAVIRGQLGKHLRRVFVGPDGVPMDEWKTYAQKAWKSACNEAGIVDFRWHDIRHTWASWHVQQGTPLYALKELGGWETLEIVKRYAHLAPEHLQQYADRVTLGSVLMAQIRHSDGSGEEADAGVSS